MAKQTALDAQSRTSFFRRGVARLRAEAADGVGPLRSSQLPSVGRVSYPAVGAEGSSIRGPPSAFGVWRKFSGVPAADTDDGQALPGPSDPPGQEVFSVIYGENYRNCA